MHLSRNQSWLPRRPPTASSPNASTPSSKVKGKERSTGSADSDLASRLGHTTDNFGLKSLDTFPALDSSASHSNYSTSIPSRNRTSILSVASDALGLRKKIGSVSRKKTNFHSAPYTSDPMPGVIEINAQGNTTIISTVAGATTHKDCEHEERERLRDAAAQSIGLDPELLHDSSRSECRSFLDSPPSPSLPPSIPPFPATLTALQPFIELSATLPKFTPPSSLLSYALAKQWKPRTIVLTSHSPSQKTHVHLFKGVSRDEREVERLEVTEDSVIYVADEDVGGRGNVVKFAGKDVLSKRSGPMGEESLRTTWFLQITDPAESQRWIAAIKNTVLTQRAMRAGLDIPTQMNGGNEPKGDMDVMFSMHLQRIISTRATRPSITPPPPTSLISPSPSPSLRSLKINIPSSPSPTTTMKGIFSGTRPRSPSVDGSPTLPYPPGHAEESFGAAGTSLLTMLRTKSSTDSSSSPSQTLALAQGRGSPAPSFHSTNAPVVITASDLKISRERDVLDLSAVIPDASPSSSLPGSNTPPVPSLSSQGVFTLSLQPPPRRGKHSLATITTSPNEQQGLYQQANGNRSVAGNFGIPSRGSDDVTSAEAFPISPDSTSVLVGQSGSFSSGSGILGLPTAGEIHVAEQSEELTPTQSGNGIIGTSSTTDKLLTSTAITKRRSRQGVPLPKQLTPPSGPPPSPPEAEKNHRVSVESSISVSVTCAVDRPPSSSSSNSHSQPRISPRSGPSLSPIFWRRTSSSSAYSANSASASDLPSRLGPYKDSESSSSLRPAVGTGSGASLRPMSLSVLGPLPVAHIDKAKRRSMPPPRPAPNFAPPPAPQSTSQPNSLTLPAPALQKFSRGSFAQRALRHSLTSPKPPPSTALPPRPDEVTFTYGHRRSSSTGTPDFHSIAVSSPHPPLAVSGSSTPTQPSSLAPRSLSIRQRLRILSTPPAPLSPISSPSSPMPSIQVSTLDLSDDNDDDLPTPHLQPCQPFGLGEHIITMQNDPSFLQLSIPDTPTIPKPPPRSPFRPIPSSSSSSSSTAELAIPPPEPDHDFVALSPPPPRRSSKPIAAATTRLDKPEVERSESSAEGLVTLAHHGSVVSLGFVTT